MLSVPDESARTREDAPKWAGVEEGGGVQAQCFFQVLLGYGSDFSKKLKA